MIKTGIDIIEIERFSKMKNLDSFLKRVFTKREREYFSSKKNPYESIAGHYAAKEAFSKYMGTGFRGFSLDDIEIYHNSLNKPCIRFMGNEIDVDLSISHSRNNAVAVICGEEAIMDSDNAQYIKEYQSLLPRRSKYMHKGDCGKVLVVAGSLGMTGASVLCGKAALKTGCGLVTIATPECQRSIVAGQFAEAMTMPLKSNNGIISPDVADTIGDIIKGYSSCAIGPGLGREENLYKVVESAIKARVPLVIDADGLNALEKHTSVLEEDHGDIVITPHMGEMSRLCGVSVDDIEKNREKIATEFAVKTNTTVLIKGHNSIIASPRGEVHINPTGNNGMATGGSGDVLTGVIASFMGQGLDGYKAAVLGAFIHGLAGDIAAEELGFFGMIAGDILERVPKAILKIQNP